MGGSIHVTGGGLLKERRFTDHPTHARKEKEEGGEGVHKMI